MTAAGSGAARRWSRLYWVAPAIVVAAAVLVLLARWLRTLPSVEAFLVDYPGDTPLPSSTPVGLPVWLEWQHVLNAFFLVMIVRTGWLVRTRQRPAAHWTRNNSGLLRTANPPKKISIDLWLHLSLDVLWVLNGVVFMVLLFSTGQWMRIVPISWAVVPNALSAALQYLSLDWPQAQGWTNYNGLQLLSYFVTVFVAAPLAIITGIRMSGAWPQGTHRLNRAYPVELARAVHFPTMLYFVVFIIVHVVLVLSTGALRNLNHMFAARDDTSWFGFVFFVVALLAIAVAWIAAQPIILRPIASLTGKVSK